ncbi:MAG: UDP-3-O-acyl-N-acetylglucosamine deacetylase [Nitrospirae bacterium]|nr:UDP-3-O-acyl-N-acetylglucosamine deacetylase [Nitrospirota bacterium]
METSARSQRTIGGSVRFEGIGLHTGERCRLTLSPAPVNTGVEFHARNGHGPVRFAADPEAIVETRLATTLGRNGTKVRTVEHFLATLAGLAIDNVIAEVEGGEIPILDGSADSFVRLIEHAGIVSQSEAQPYIRVLSPVSVVEGDRWVRISPADRLRVTYVIDYGHPAFGVQGYDGVITRETFVREIAPARTFGFLRDVEEMKRRGLIRGGSLENAIVLDDREVINEEGLRYEDEFVRHKVLDLIGDLRLLGLPIVGHVEAQKSGHDLNTRLVQALARTPSAWERVGDPSPRGDLSLSLSSA